MVHVPCFGDVDIGKCPTKLNLDGMDEHFLGEDILSRFIANNFRTFRKSGKNYAVCRGENSLAAIILIVDGIFHTDFFELSKCLLCEKGDLWRIISEKSLGNDIRKSFPPFYISLLKLLKELKLLYTNVKPDDDAPAAIVFPDYDKLISGWLPRTNCKEILQRGIGLLAGEKNGMVLECLYGAELSDDERVLGRICNYKNGVFTLKCKDGREVTRPVQDCEYLFAAADRDPELSDFFDSYIELIEEIESKVEYDRIGVGQKNDGLVMRNGGYKSVVYKMK